MKERTIRIATWNLQKCVGLDLRRRPDRSLQVLERIAPDIAVLQEADKRLAPRPAALPHRMAEEHGWTVVDFGEPAGSLGWHGNAMLIRGPVEVEDTGRIDLPGLEPRGAIRADLATPVGPLRVIGAHLGLVRRYRLLQLHAIRRALEHLPERPGIIAGDFNEWGDGRAIEGPLAPWRLLPPAPSYPAPRPVAPLDRFAVHGLSASAPRAWRTAPAAVASDHLPVWCEIGPPRRRADQGAWTGDGGAEGAGAGGAGGGMRGA